MPNITPQGNRSGRNPFWRVLSPKAPKLEKTPLCSTLPPSYVTQRSCNQFLGPPPRFPTASSSGPDGSNLGHTQSLSSWVLPVGSLALTVRSEYSCCQGCRKHGFDPWVRKIPLRRKWQSTPVFLSGKSHGHRSLVGYSPQGRRSDTTE